MRNFFLASLSIVILFGVGIAARTIATTPNFTRVQLAQNPNCNNPQTQTDMNICAGIFYRNADRKLNQIYQRMLPKVPAARKQKLIAAQQAWIRFRDTSCEFERSEFEGGTIAPLIHGNCMTTVTEQRTKDLERYLDDLDK